MAGLLHKARRYLFGYDAVEPKNRRQAPTGRLRSEDHRLRMANNANHTDGKAGGEPPGGQTDRTRSSRR